MDAFIKFGEHYYLGSNNNFVSSLAITLIGTFIGFFLALLANRALEKRNEKKKREEDVKIKLNHLNYLRSILDSVISLLPKQIERYNDYSEVVKQSPLEVSLPKVLATFDLLRLRNADNVDTQSAYLHFFKGEEAYKDYKNLFARGDYLFREFDSIEKQVENSIKFKHKDQLVIRNLMEEIAFLLGCRMQDIQNNIGITKAQKDPEWLFLSKTATMYHGLISTMLNFEDVSNKFITPIMQFAPQIQDRVLGREVTSLVIKANSRVLNIRENALVFADDIGNTEQKFSDTIEEFKTRVSQISELPENRL